MSYVSPPLANNVTTSFGYGFGTRSRVKFTTLHHCSAILVQLDTLRCQNIQPTVGYRCAPTGLAAASVL